MPKKSDRLISLLQAKRRSDPKGFRKYLPDVTDLLPEPPRRSTSKSPFGLTERERVFHHNGLRKILCSLEKGGLTPAHAAKGLHHYAMLIRDDNFSQEIAQGDFKALVKAAVGKSPASFRANATVPLGEGGQPVERIAPMRGVYLDLDGERCLVSVTINPGKVREFRKLMKIVGIGADTESDVSSLHDHYLAMQEPHGSTQ